MRQVIGYFIVTQPDSAERVVVVSQDLTVSQDSVVVAAHKVFTLDSADGEEVIGNEKKSFFKKGDGQPLKVIGHCIANERDLLEYQMRRRRQKRLHRGL